MKKLLQYCFFISSAFIVGCSPQSDELQEASTAQEEAVASDDAFEEQLEEYYRLFPYQDTVKYAQLYTDGDPSKLNVWAFGVEAKLVKAGEDTVVGMNNDTFYKMAFVSLADGPVLLESSAPTKDRFYSFQLMDDRNANYRNVIHPSGEYTLYYGEEPEEIVGEPIQVPSELSVVGVRVEVKDKNNKEDVAAAESVFYGLTISGPTLAEFPSLDLLSGFSEEVVAEANRRMDEVFQNVHISNLVVGPGQKPGRDVSYLYLASGTKQAWGGPEPAHSAYETVFFDKNDEPLRGRNGTYTLTTEEPPVNAFWSITIYDYDRGGFLHPNDEDKYHINNTTAVKNADGTVTFTFKQDCESSDINCLEVPAGQFYVAGRFYLPTETIISGDWLLPKVNLQTD
jgi:hypothetical protein